MHKIHFVQSVFLFFLLAAGHDINAAIRYVKPVAAGSANGSSWSNASADLQSMINASASGDEVWVAAGTYLPVEDQAGVRTPADPRNKTFHIPEGVKIYGGFGGSETSITARNLTVNITLLSGDLGVPNDNSDNAYHVVSNILPNYSSSGCTLDGLRIRYGNASGGGTQNYGGGIRLYKGTGVVLSNLHISNNNAVANGGGLYAEETDIRMVQDAVYDNASGFGGGIYTYATTLFIDSCTFYSNSAGTGGGLALGTYSSGTINHCSVYGNSANSSVGGGIYISISNSVYCINNSVYNNSANNYWGGGIYFEGGNFGVLHAWNNSFFGNTAQKGAAIYHNDGTGNYSNNTIFGNAASIEGGGISKLGGAVNFRNNIFRLNKKNNNSAVSGADFVISGFSTNTFYNNIFQLPVTGYSLGTSAGGNIFGADPLFVNAALPLGADNIPGTADDGLALSACSPAINSGVTLSPAVSTDILGNGRVGNYDIGAYEFQGTLPVPVGTISGDSVICLHNTVALTNSVPGGTWMSSDTTVATVSATGIVTGVRTGTSVISYSSGTSGCPGTVAMRNVTVTIFNAPGSITGPDTVCTTKNIQLSNVTPGGVWSSSNSTVAIVGSTGLVTGIASGTAMISYTTGGRGCSGTETKTITVIASPIVNSITGDYWVCQFGTPQYTCTTPGGVWSTASNGSRSTISSTGALTPLSAGADTVIYTVTNALGCQQSSKLQIMIVAIPALFNNLSGPGTVCASRRIQLTNVFSGGSWRSDNTAVATVSALGIVTGVSAGSATISYTYTNPSYGCTATTTKVITVNAAPIVSPVTGNNVVCMGSSLQLSNATAGGSWSTSSGGLKTTVSTTGLVLPVSAGGTDTVFYVVTNSAGCADTTYRIISIGVNPVVSSILGTDSLCANSSDLFTNATAGGVWSSASTAIATVAANGSITGHNAGLTAITYTVTNPPGCAAAVSKNIYIKAAPATDPVTGPSTVCLNSVTSYNNNTPGGRWSTSSNGSITGIALSGSLIAHTAGTDTVRYTVTNAAGCISVAEMIVTVNAPLSAPITGPDSLCAGTGVQLIHPVAGGAWTNFAATTGSVNGSGLYTSIAPGTDTVYYQYMSNGCVSRVKRSLAAVQQDSATISGAASVCKGDTRSLVASIAGGIWSSANSAVATVSPTGSVKGIGSGNTNIKYVITNALGCVASSTHVIAVNAPVVTTSVSGAVLTATGNQSGATYQWVDCSKSYQPISGAQNPVYTALSNGQYAVVITYQGCTDTSACLNVVNLGAAPVAGSHAAIVSYPGNGHMLINTGNIIPGSMKLYDIQGKLVKTISPDKAETTVDVSDYSKGIYILHLYFPGNTTVIKVDIR